jgi:thiosulfate/3-mercaptopyruvate sulfurtransferase
MNHTPAPFTTLISAVQLQQLIAAGAAPCVVDVGFDLADTQAGERAWRAGHLPGSRYLHLDRDLAGATTGPDGVFRGRHPLPQREAFAATLGRCGITPATQVVAFDAQGGMYAARLWWMLRWMGHSAVAVLDGGPAAWRAAGGALETTEPPPVANLTPYPAATPLALSIDADALAAQLGRVRLIDARAAERFRGEVEPLDAAAGHIPGALNRCFKDNLEAGGLFKPAAQLRAELEPLLGRQPAVEVVHQCGSGVTACHNLLAMEHAGLAGSVLYPGSWSEWSADPARPIAKG